MPSRSEDEDGMHDLGGEEKVAKPAKSAAKALRELRLSKRASRISYAKAHISE
jgi:hypothetical protein